jgi:SPOR domain
VKDRAHVALAWLGAALLLVSLSAATPPAHPASSPPPAMRGIPAAVDSGPSEDARRVLETIPEPLAPAERVAPPKWALAAARTADSLRLATARADSARVAALGDSLGVAADSLGAAADSLGADTSAVPIPAPVAPLGSTGREAAIDSAIAASRLADTTRVAAAATPPGECWGVQVGAPTEREKAEALRSAAQSLLMVPMTIRSEGGRYKVRTTRCLGSAAADSLRHRATMSGFSGSFRFGGKP